MTLSIQHQVVQRLILRRSSQQHLVSHMQVQPQQQKAVEAVRAPLSSVNSHDDWSPASRIAQPWATGILTPECLLADEVKSSLQQLCLPLRSLLCFYLAWGSSHPALLCILSVIQHAQAASTVPAALLLPPVDPCVCDVLVHRPDCSCVAAAVCHAEPHCQAASGQQRPPPVPWGAPAPGGALLPALL